MNWDAVARWASDHQSRMLFWFYVWASLSPAILAPAIGLRFFFQSKKLDFQVLKYTAITFICWGVRILFQAAASIDRPKDVHYSSWFGWNFWLGEMCPTVALHFLFWLVFISPQLVAKGETK